MEDIFVGRQAIYNKDLDVYAYELLYRDGDVNNANISDGNQATSQTVLNAFLEIGIENITDQHPAFINLNENLLVNGNLSYLPKDKIVLEIMEDVPVTDDVKNALSELSQKGYVIALDNFILNNKLIPLIDFAKIIKIDLRKLGQQAIEDHVKQLQQHDIKLLAGKVETRQEFSYCKSLGFDYFQGYFLSKPNIVKGRRTPASRIAVLELLALLHKSDVDLSKLAESISKDVSLSYRILRYINSAYFSVGRQIESIKSAVTLLGINNIKQLVQMIAITNIDDKPHDLLNTALVRAKMNEQLSEVMSFEKKDVHFTIGLFSVLDALLDLPMEEVIKTIPLSKAANNALLRQEGEYGRLLGITIAYDEGDWDKVLTSGLDVETLRSIYLNSVNWAYETLTAALIME
jgi:EAL and modified HD-GYP domain-containing signal transduction protein